MTDDNGKGFLRQHLWTGLVLLLVVGGLVVAASRAGAAETDQMDAQATLAGNVCSAVDLR